MAAGSSPCWFWLWIIIALVACSLMIVLEFQYCWSLHAAASTKQSRLMSEASWNFHSELYLCPTVSGLLHNALPGSYYFMFHVSERIVSFCLIFVFAQICFAKQPSFINTGKVFTPLFQLWRHIFLCVHQDKAKIDNVKRSDVLDHMTYRRIL